MTSRASGWALNLALGLAALLGGCEDSDFDKCREVEPAASALFGGSARYWSEWDLAVVALLAETEGVTEERLCSGVLISSSYVLTAKHCVPAGTTITALFGRTVESPRARARVIEVFPDPTRDLAVVQLERSNLPPVTPIEPLAGVPAVGDEVTIAGFGVDEDGGVGRLLFADEDVIDVSAEKITVLGDGESGACVGDSGGPLLVKDDDADRPRVAGVLSVGSASCTGIDRYQRIDGAAEMIEQLTADDDEEPGSSFVDPTAGGC